MKPIKNFDRKVETGKIKFKKGETGVVMLEEKRRLIDDDSGETEIFWKASEWSSDQLERLALDQDKVESEATDRAREAKRSERFIREKMKTHVKQVEDGDDGEPEILPKTKP